MPTIEAVLQALREVGHPHHIDNMLSADDFKELFFEDDKLILTFAFPRGEGAPFSQFQRQVLTILKQKLNIPKIKLDYEKRVEPQVSVTTRSRMIELYPQAQFYAVMSGKGGVGKSTVAYALAQGFTQLGKKTAIIDADIYGASMPQLMKLPKTAPTAEGTKLKPFSRHGIDIISSSLLIFDDKPVMWKGPMISRLFQQFLYDVAWDPETDVFIFDMPPGTGDIMFTLHEFLPEVKVVVVTTPQEDAAYVTIKSGQALHQLGLDIVGVVENMAYLECEHCQQKTYIFGKDGGSYVAEALASPLLGSIPLKVDVNGTDVAEIIETLLKKKQK